MYTQVRAEARRSERSRVGRRNPENPGSAATCLATANRRFLADEILPRSPPSTGLFCRQIVPFPCPFHLSCPCCCSRLAESDPIYQRKCHRLAPPSIIRVWNTRTDEHPRSYRHSIVDRKCSFNRYNIMFILSFSLPLRNSLHYIVRKLRCVRCNRYDTGYALLHLERATRNRT